MKGACIMENNFITITGMNHYLGMKPYKINRLVKLVKESDNTYDPEAIRVELPFIDTIGYVANSVNTVFAGTYSAGRLYDKFEDHAYAQVMFITHSSVIAIVVPKEEVEENDAPDMDSSSIQAEPRDINAPKAKIGF
ncbi:MAG: HIRAN domain-containing protein [Oscillospiraceae bacterium]